MCKLMQIHIALGEVSDITMSTRPIWILIGLSTREGKCVCSTINCQQQKNGSDDKGSALVNIIPSNLCENEPEKWNIRHQTVLCKVKHCYAHKRIRVLHSSVPRFIHPEFVLARFQNKNSNRYWPLMYYASFQTDYGPGMEGLFTCRLSRLYRQHTYSMRTHRLCYVNAWSHILHPTTPATHAAHSNGRGRIYLGVCVCLFVCAREQPKATTGK